MGAVKKFDYPKYVWSPTGGWWCQPRNWKRNTAIAFIASALISIPIIKWGRENEVGSFLFIDRFICFVPTV